MKDVNRAEFLFDLEKKTSGPTFSFLSGSVMERARHFGFFIFLALADETKN